MNRAIQTFLVLGGAYLFDRLMSLVHEVLHITWGIIAREETYSCDIYFLPVGDSIPIGARETWHGVPQFHGCVDWGSGIAPAHFNGLFATVGSVIVAILIIGYSSRIGNKMVRWIVTVGAIYSGYRYALYSGGLLNHPQLENGELVTWLGDGGIILSGFGELAIIPAIIGVVSVSIVTYTRLQDSREACTCKIPTEHR